MVVEEDPDGVVVAEEGGVVVVEAEEEEADDPTEPTAVATAVVATISRFQIQAVAMTCPRRRHRCRVCPRSEMK